MRHYLNENIFIENDIFFYEENEKKIKIKERDWHIYLSDSSIVSNIAFGVDEEFIDHKK